MKKFNKSKKSQFYLISAAIIIFIILSLTAVSNYATVKKQPEKILQLSDVLKTEGQYVLENAQYNPNLNVEQTIKEYLKLFSRYIQEETPQDFSMIILYGNINDGTIKGLNVAKSSTGSVNFDLGGDQTFTVPGGTQLYINETEVTVSKIAGTDTANITIISNGNVISQIVPLRQNNNFISVMATNDGFNQYVKRNFPTNP